MKKKEQFPVWGYWLVGILLFAVVVLALAGVAANTHRRKSADIEKRQIQRVKQHEEDEAKRIIRIEAEKVAKEVLRSKVAALKAASDKIEKAAWVQSKKAEPAPTNPAETQGSLTRKISENYFGATSEEVFEKLVRLATQHDEEAFNSYMLAGMLSGQVRLFEKGEEVFIVETAIFSGKVKVRKKGDFKEYWTVTEAVKQ